MESNAASLKKLKREAAQRRKAQARSLKLRAEEQERLQRLEIDALVEQQRLQRLERQRRKEDAERLAHEAQGLSLQSNISANGNETHTKGKHSSSSTSGGSQVQSASSNKGGGEEGKKPSKEHKEAKPASKQVSSSNNASQQAQLQKQQQERAIAENRKKLAKGSSSRGVLESATSSVVPSLVAAIPATSNGSGSVLPSEDHRVVSTEYQAAGTQALMRVTLLAAGFVIGARGISARLIGQMTGAIIQSWTEPTACKQGNVNGSVNGVPIRLFRIQGKKSVVQAAVSLVEQAVAKYKELCECKRRGEFVQREHVINGVEFYYQPPPRKAFVVPEHSLASGSGTSPPFTASKAPSPGNVAPALSSTFSTSPDVPLANSIHHVWLQHLNQAQQQRQAQLQRQTLQQQAVAEQLQDNKSVNLEDVPDSPASDGFSPVQTEPQGEQRPSTSESLTGSAEGNHGTPAAASAWGTSVTSEQQHVFQEESSLFSIFGNGGLPLPIAQDCRPPNAPFLKSSVSSSTPFDFPKYDFFREVFPAFPPPFQTAHGEGYNLFAHHQLHQLPPVQPADKQPFVVCVERPPPRFVEQ